MINDKNDKDQRVCANSRCTSEMQALILDNWIQIFLEIIEEFDNLKQNSSRSAFFFFGM